MAEESERENGQERRGRGWSLDWTFPEREREAGYRLLYAPALRKRESWWVMVLLLHCARGLVGGVA